MLNVIGMVGGLIICLVALRARKAMAKTLSDQMAGRIDDREAARIRLAQKQRSFGVVRVICVFLALLLLAFVGRAWVSDAWDARAVYSIGIVGALLSVGLFTLWQAHQDLERTRAPWDT